MDYFESEPRVLILGESVYESEDGIPSPNVAAEMIQGVSSYEWNHSFFSRIQDMFSCPDDYDEVAPETYELNRESFWKRVSFYEYVQEPVTGPRARPSAAQWANAEHPFKEVVDKLLPDVIVALGFDNYSHLPDLGKEAREVVYRKNILQVWQYNLPGKNCFVCCIQHPSSFGFKKQIWTELFDRFLIQYGYV